MKPMPWYRTAMRWGQTNLVECDPDRYDDAFWRAHWRATRIDGVIVNGGGIVAYYPSAFPLHKRAEKLGDRDLFGDIVASARDEGLSVIARLDSNRVDRTFAEAHPDWICRDSDGAPYRMGDKFATCIGSPYYSDYIPSVMEEIIAHAGPDGFADNSWAGLTRQHVCHCTHCRTQFEAHAGAPLPVRHDWADPVYRDWVRWSYARRVELWKRNNEVTRRAGGQDCLWSGMISADILYNSLRFIDLKTILTDAPFVMVDSQRRNAEDGFELNAETGKRFHELAGWDKLMPESMAQYQLGAPAFYRLTSMPEAEVRLWSASAFAGGIQPWWHHIGASHEDRRQYRMAAPIFRWHEENQDILADRTPRADVGIVWSQQNNDVFGRDQARQKTHDCYRGAVRAMTRAGLPYLPIHVDDIAAAIGKVKVLLLPNIGALSDAQVAAIQAFADKGGSVIATGETSSRRADGVERDALALGPLFGLRMGPGRHGGIAPRIHDFQDYSRHSYLRLSPEVRRAAYGPRDETAPAQTEERRHPILAGFDEADILPFGGYLPEVTVDPDVRVLASFVPESPLFPPETAWLRVPRSDLPCITLKEGGNGARLIWFVADLDRCFAREENPEHADLLANAVRWATPGGPAVTLDGGHGVVVPDLFEQAGRSILHLGNRLQLTPLPGRQTDIVPIGPVQVTLRPPKPGLSARQVTLRVAGGVVQTRQDGDAITFSVARIEDHEVVVIDWDGTGPDG